MEGFLDSLSGKQAQKAAFGSLFELNCLMIYDDVIIYIIREYEMRTIIDLPDNQVKALRTICEQTRLSRAELIRRAVDDYLGRHLPENDIHAFGLWRSRAEDGLSYQNRVTKDWDE